MNYHQRHSSTYIPKYVAVHHKHYIVLFLSGTLIPYADTPSNTKLYKIRLQAVLFPQYCLSSSLNLKQIVKQTAFNLAFNLITEVTAVTHMDKPEI